MNYEQFIKELDVKLANYFELHKDYIHCKPGCSACCEKGDYPLTSIELEYLMKGYIALDNTTKQVVQQNINEIEKGGTCPFLVDKKCSVYAHRPIICRVHGLAYRYKENKLKLPYCANYGLNYANILKNGEIIIDIVFENLDTQNILKTSEFGETRNLYDWIKR